MANRKSFYGTRFAKNQSPSYFSASASASARNLLTFANTAAIAYGRKTAQSLKLLAVCSTVAVVFANVRKL